MHVVSLSSSIFFFDCRFAYHHTERGTIFVSIIDAKWADDVVCCWVVVVAFTIDYCFCDERGVDAFLLPVISLRRCTYVDAQILERARQRGCIRVGYCGKGAVIVLDARIDQHQRSEGREERESAK